MKNTLFIFIAFLIFSASSFVDNYLYIGKNAYLKEDGTDITLNYNGASRLRINKIDGSIQSNNINIDTGISAFQELWVKSTTGVVEDFYVEGDSRMTGYLNMPGGAGTYLKIPTLTSLQIAALTPAEGMVVYDSTLDKLQVYANGAWVNLH
jgi:hypothetical protein